MSLVQIETQWSNPIAFGKRKIILQSRAWQVRLPFGIGGIVWNRPIAVLIVSGDGRDQMVPVHDVTRLAQALIFALGIAAAILIGLTRSES